MKKAILIILLASCVSAHDAEKHLGTGATCIGTAHGAYLCSSEGKSYVCMSHDQGCSMDIACVETVGALK